MSEEALHPGLVLPGVEAVGLMTAAINVEYNLNKNYTKLKTAGKPKSAMLERFVFILYILCRSITAIVYQLRHLITANN